MAGIRFYAARNHEDQVTADCRVNGEDYPAGQEALLLYGKSWPEAGFEYRKQYILLLERRENLSASAP